MIEGAYEFKDHVLDLERGALLTADGEEVALRPRSYALLRLLLANPGRLLERAFINEIIWPDRTVTDENISQCIRDVRRAIRDDDQTIVKTIHRRGYKFIGKVNLRNYPQRFSLPHTAERMQHPSPEVRRLDNVPVPRNSMIGRDRDVAELFGLLADKAGHRLITLTGPAGAGKTRLAAAVAQSAGLAFSAGVCFVPLAPVLDHALVPSAIFRALRLQESGSIKPENMLIDYLRHRNLLLVLDNFEHVLEAAKWVSKELLFECEGLKVLVTSRAALLVEKVFKEREHKVVPLEVPPGDPGHVDALRRYSAASLFVDRVTSADPSLELSPADISAISELCRKLDGLPLAIELAAARVRTFKTPWLMLKRLERGDWDSTVDFLNVSSRDAPDHHRTMSVAIEWSYSLLKAPSKLVFELCSVFVGGFTDEAVIALAKAMEELPGSEPALTAGTVTDALSELTEHNLIQEAESSGETEVRYSMLETIRQFGVGCLKDERRNVLLRLHAKYMFELALRIEEGAGGKNQKFWLKRFEEELANFRSALRWLFSKDESLGSKLCAALWKPLFRRTYFHEGYRLMHQGHAAAEPCNIHLQAKLLAAEGAFARILGEFARAKSILDDSISFWRNIGDEEGEAWSLSHLGLVEQWLGNINNGVCLLERSLAARRRVGQPEEIGRSLFNLAVAEDFRENYPRAVELYNETLENKYLVGDTWGIGRVKGYLARVMLHQGRVREAKGLCAEAGDLACQVGDSWGMGLAQLGVGRIAWAEHKPHNAFTKLKESLQTFRDVGSQDWIAECLQYLAFLLQESGLIEQYVIISGSTGPKLPQENLLLWPAVNAQRKERLDLARRELGDVRVSEVLEAGSNKSLTEATNYVLEIELRTDDLDRSAENSG